ncbi:MAG: DNA cytosine methyltransferase [Microcystis sp. M034S1]|uniref:DNA cytosine methyltransferase n=1 Tax=Microcystis sp. M034S1 TaxID=2771111 RepID=UPI002584A483|nr:DNA (cytosine-5-)-methyltransferase [Microcystis sp. M034S1]MCA2909087.1 DNA cytosine methyltransferase [Microcystis sp. M034S1]
MRAIELFCGIGGFRIALDRIGIETVFANDISDKACEVYKSNFPGKVLVQKDLRSILSSEIPDHELLTAGFPCQPFSQAGRKQGILCPINGTLFEQIVRLLNDKKPRFFLLENVQRILSMENGFHFATVLNELSQLGYVVEWRVLNAASFGIPQFRQRVFIGGWRDNGDAEFSPRMRASDSLFSSVSRQEMKSISTTKSKFKLWGMAVDGKFIHRDVGDDVPLDQQKTLNTILQQPDEVDPIYDYSGRMNERIANSTKVNRFHNGVEILFNQKGGARFGYTVFGTKGYASTLTASTSRHYERYLVGDKFRRLTNIEYARLMGFPDQWCRSLSKYDQHSVYGNAVVPDCVEWALKKITING